MKKSIKITFIEPYLGERKAGHYLKNVFYFPLELEKIGINYEFIVEKTLKTKIKNKNFKFSLLNMKNYFSFGEDCRLYRRYREYKDIILNTESNILLFLTSFEEDFKILLKVFQDKDVFGKIQKKNLLIIVHSAYLIYQSLYFHKRTTEKVIENLRQHLFFLFSLCYKVCL